MKASTLSTTTERVEKDKVKLRVEAAEDAFTPSLDAAYRRFAQEIRVPGFRKGKVPRQLIDARVGPGAVREEALRDALPRLYREALEAEKIEPIASPDINVVSFDEGAGIVFEATIDVRPEISLPDLSSINVESPPAEVTDEDVDQQLERLRERFAELEAVGREARRGDFVLIDLKGHRHDQPVEGASAPDFLYELGSRSGPPKLDDELEGARPGAILKFNATPSEGEMAGEEISFTVLVKEVKAKKLPELDDDFAKTVGEFDTLDALKADLRERLAEIKKSLVEEQTRTNALEALVDASDLEAPDRLVEDEFKHRLHHLEEDLQRAGLDVAEYSRRSQTTELEVRSEIRAQATRAVKAELLLEEIARSQQVEVTEEDLGREVALLAARTGTDAKKLAEELVSSGRLPAVAADIMRRKALDHVVKTVNVVGRVADEG
jgi:trigger factor